MKAETYAHSVIENKILTLKYVKLQCKEFLDILDSKTGRELDILDSGNKAGKAEKEKDDKNRSKASKYFIDLKRLEMIEQTLKTMIMLRGLRAGDTIYDCSCGYQWLFYTSILCVLFTAVILKKRRYEMAILEIGRKNFKTFTIATIFILLFLLEPKFSKFYSVAPDGSRSRLVKEAVTEILKSSPKIYLRDEKNGKTRFKILRDYIQFNLNENTYYPLNYSNSSMDRRMPNVS